MLYATGQAIASTRLCLMSGGFARKVIPWIFVENRRRRDVVNDVSEVRVPGVYHFLPSLRELGKLGECLGISRALSGYGWVSHFEVDLIRRMSLTRQISFCIGVAYGQRVSKECLANAQRLSCVWCM